MAGTGPALPGACAPAARQAVGSEPDAGPRGLSGAERQTKPGRLRATRGPRCREDGQGKRPKGAGGAGWRFRHRSVSRARNSAGSSIGAQYAFAEWGGVSWPHPQRFAGWGGPVGRHALGRECKATPSRGRSQVRVTLGFSFFPALLRDKLTYNVVCTEGVQCSNFYTTYRKSLPQ